MKKSYSIYDIARELNISPSTVSKAINNNGKISEKTRHTVKEFISEKGYTPNVVASSLKSKVSLSIGVAYPVDTVKDVMTHFFFSHVIAAFREYVEHVGYEFCYVTNRLGSYEVSYAEYCLKRSLDGVLILGATSINKDMIEIIDAGCPAVSIDYIDDRIPFVQTDDKMGAEQMIDYFLKQNITDIGYISGPFHLGEFRKRTNTFIKVLEEKGLTIDDEKILETDGTDFDAGYNGAIKLFKNLNKFPKALAVSNDEIAFGVIRGIESLGYHVPEDVKVIGFDDMFFAKYYTPSLTTVRQECEKIGRTAGEILIDLLKGKPIQKENYISCQLVVRDSSKETKNE